MMNKNNTGPRPSDKWIPWYFVAFYVVLTLTIAPMVYIAVRTMPGVVTDHAYEKGLAYNRSIAAGEQERALGWRAELEVSPSGGGETTVSFNLQDAQGAGVADAAVHVWAVRPVQGGVDQDIDMTAVGGGRYQAKLTLPERGVWDIRVSATSGAHNFQSDKRIVIP